MQFNLDLALLVDQVVNHSCSANERGQYCATVQLENVNNDVCIVNVVVQYACNYVSYFYIAQHVSPAAKAVQSCTQYFLSVVSDCGCLCIELDCY